QTTVVGAAGQGLAVGRKRKWTNAVALLSVLEAAKFLAGLHFPEPGEVAVVVLVITAGRHQFAVRREGESPNSPTFVCEFADRIDSYEVDQIDNLGVRDCRDRLAVRGECEDVGTAPRIRFWKLDRANFPPRFRIADLQPQVRFGDEKLPVGGERNDLGLMILDCE